MPVMVIEFRKKYLIVVRQNGEKTFKLAFG